LTALAASGVTPLVLFFAFTYINIWLLMIALGSLLYYLVYLFTGKRVFLKLILIIYSGMFLFFLWFINSLNPTGVEVTDWSATLAYDEEIEISQAWVYALLLGLIGPQVVFAGLYFTLAFRLKNPEARARVAMVSMSLFLWFGSSIFFALIGLSRQPYWPPVSRLIGFSAALVIYLAYDMPGWLRRRIGADSEPMPAEGMHVD
jgi:hypothetical protein